MTSGHDESRSSPRGLSGSDAPACAGVNVVPGVSDLGPAPDVAPGNAGAQSRHHQRRHQPTRRVPPARMAGARPRSDRGGHPTRPSSSERSGGGGEPTSAYPPNSARRACPRPVARPRRPASTRSRPIGCIEGNPARGDGRASSVVPLAPSCSRAPLDRKGQRAWGPWPRPLTGSRRGALPARPPPLLTGGFVVAY